MRKVTLLTMLTLLMVGVCGCEDEGDRTVNEAPEVVTGTNGNPAIVVDDTDGIVVIDLVTGTETPAYDVVVSDTGSNGVVSIKTSPYVPPVPEPESP